jgi:putative ATPase
VSDDTLPLFPDAPFAAGGVGPAPDAGGGAAPRGAADGEPPLAERMRPRTLDELVGQEALVGESGTLRRLLRSRRIPSLILHGPPGSGKTTLARLLAGEIDAEFIPFSAVSEGVPRLREIVKEAERNRKEGRRTLLFVDEIHRLNKGQQDFLLPFVESGLVTLVGATTEHPAFEVNAALLSRSRVLLLAALGEEELRLLVRRALEDEARGLGGRGVELDPAAEELLVTSASGDARQALGALEIAVQLAGPEGEVTDEVMAEALQRRLSRYDASTAAQLLSAFHKSLRSSQGDAALYWGMRIVRAGEDPLVLLRRLVAAAYEDVGLADPQAGIVATQAMQAYERLGPPEGFLPLANAILYVANAPKSNHAYLALKAATEAADQLPDAPVPLHLRNAHSRLMKEWGYGKEYRYAHDYEGAYVEMQCLPDELADARFYEPSDRGFEQKIAARMKERGQRKGEE